MSEDITDPDRLFGCTYNFFFILPVSVSELDVHPAGDQKGASKTPATFFRRDLIMKYFLWSFSPFH